MFLERPTYFQECNNIFTPVQTRFMLSGLTVDQVLLLLQSIADFFYQSKLGARAVFATVDFAKAFNSVWQPAFLSKLFFIGLPISFVE